MNGGDVGGVEASQADTIYKYNYSQRPHHNPPGEDARHPSRCFTYPQGELSILPQILTLMAAFSSIMAFPVFWFNDDSNFLCVQLSVNGTLQNPQCTQLRMNDVSYWQDDNAADWATALQIAAVLGVLACILGVLSLGMLLTATCFYFQPEKLKMIVMFLVLAAMLSALTLAANSASFCQTTVIDATCSVHKVRLSTGAGFMIFASVLYTIAAIETFRYYLKAQRTTATGGSSSEFEFLTRSAAPDPDFDDPAVTITRTVLPDGKIVVESEYLDENGQLVQEKRVEDGGSPAEVSGGRAKDNNSLSNRGVNQRVGQISPKDEPSRRRSSNRKKKSPPRDDLLSSAGPVV